MCPQLRRSFTAQKVLCAAPSQPSLPGPLDTTDLFPVSIVLSFPEFSDWFLSLKDDFFLNTAITTLFYPGAQ